MAETEELAVLKTALLLERQGQAFYTHVAATTKAPAVAGMFRIMAEEEARHQEALSRQFARYAAGGAFEAEALEDAPRDLPAQVLSEEVRAQISASDYEAAAISAAIEMENRAVRLYSERAASATDPGERQLYEWLARWERGHLSFLAKLDEELRGEIWEDNGFWPF